MLIKILYRKIFRARIAVLFVGCMYATNSTLMIIHISLFGYIFTRKYRSFSFSVFVQEDQNQRDFPAQLPAKT